VPRRIADAPADRVARRGSASAGAVGQDRSNQNRVCEATCWAAGMATPASRRSGRCDPAPGSNTIADHLRPLEKAIAAVPRRYWQRLMPSATGASHRLIEPMGSTGARADQPLTQLRRLGTQQAGEGRDRPRTSPRPAICLSGGSSVAALAVNVDNSNHPAQAGPTSVSAAKHA
jgi:hypothetical protein